MRKIKIFLVLGIALSILIATISKEAHANPLDGWPKQIDDMVTDRVFAHGNDNLSFLNCRDTNSYTVARFDRGQGQSESIPMYSDSKARCDKSNGMGRLSSEGVFYMTKDMGISRHLAGFKNEQTLWSTNVDYEINCMYSGGTDKKSKVSAMNLGADGNLYIILTPAVSPTVCPDRFIKVNPVNGEILFDHSLAMGPGPGSGIYPTIPKLWTYDDEVLLVDQNSVLHHYSYGGVEDISKQYQFSVPNGMGIYQLIANDEGTVFATTKHIWTSLGNTPILYHETSGASGSITSRPYGDQKMPITLTDSGSVAGVWMNTIYTFNFGTNSYTTTNLGMPSGYTQSYTYGFIEDDNDHGLVVRGMKKANGDRAVSVDMVDLLSGNLTNLFLKEGSGITNPFLADEGVAGDAIADSHLYLPVCYGNGNCNNTHTAGNTKIHKIPLTGFSNLVKEARSLPTTVDTDNDGLTAAQERSQETSDVLVDSDRDGLSDYVESQWYPDRDDVFCGSQCAYPNPVIKDIYVEVDWMKDSSARSFQPTEDQLDTVIDAYAQQGITAHFDTGQYGGGNELSTYVEDLYFEPNASEADFFDYKNGTSTQSANFNADRNGIWRYLVSGYHYMETPSSSGVSYAGSDAIFISTGLITDEQVNFGYSDIDTAIAGTIIHELGHSVCLSNPSSGSPAYPTQSPNCLYGNIDTWSSPNTYSSSMNYNKQMFMVDYSKGLNGSPGDHDDWGAIGVSLADFTKPGRRIENTNEGANYEAEKLTRVRGITIEEARKAKDAGLLGISASDRSSRDTSAIGVNSVTSIPRKKGSISGPFASEHHRQDKTIMLILVAAGAIFLILSILYVRRRIKFS